MENAQNGEFSIKFTNRDKIYLSVIAVLLVAIVILAIVLPRPYKIVEVEKPVEKIVEVKAFDTQTVYIVGKDYPDFHDGDESVDINGREYTILEKFNLHDTGAFVKAVFIVTTTSDGVESTFEITLLKTLTDEIVVDMGSSADGIDVYITSDNMKDITDIVKQSLTGLSYSHTYLLKLEFEDAVATYKINYIDCTE